MNKLSSRELDILHDFLPQMLLLAVNTSNTSGGIECMTDDLKDEIRDRCIERLDLTGYDQNYNLTPTGKILENLIDKLFIG